MEKRILYGERATLFEEREMSSPTISVTHWNLILRAGFQLG